MAAIAKNTDYLLTSYQIRAHNLRAYADHFDSDKAFAKELGISPVRLHCLIRKEDNPITEKMARAIEQKLNAPLGSLDIDPHRESRYQVPIYAMEDLRDFDHAKPASYFYYPAASPSNYFVLIANKIYEPHIPMGAKILVDPSNNEFEEGRLYLLGYPIETTIKPVLKLYKKQTFRDIVTQESDGIGYCKRFGLCETVIAPLNFG